MNQAGIATSPEISQSQKRKMSTQPGEDEECPICLQNLAGLETKQCKKQCGKFMCKDCWRGNLRHGVAERRNDCPMCRQVDAFSQSQLSQQSLPSLQIEAAQPLDGSFDYDFYDSPSPILVTELPIVLKNQGRISIPPFSCDQRDIFTSSGSSSSSCSDCTKCTKCTNSTKSNKKFINNR